MRAAPRLGLAILLAALAVPHRSSADDVVVIVSPSSTISSLTKDQVSDIFLGRLKQLPGGAKVLPIDQPEGSPVRDAFYSQFAAKTPAQVKAHWAKIIFTGRGKPPATAPDANETKKRVARDPNAIAYIDRKLADGSVRILTP